MRAQERCSLLFTWRQAASEQAAKARGAIVPRGQRSRALMRLALEGRRVRNGAREKTLKPTKGKGCRGLESSYLYWYNCMYGDDEESAMEKERWQRIR